MGDLHQGTQGAVCGDEAKGTSVKPLAILICKNFVVTFKKKVRSLSPIISNQNNWLAFLHHKVWFIQIMNIRLPFQGTLFQSQQRLFSPLLCYGSVMEQWGLLQAPFLTHTHLHMTQATQKQLCAFFQAYSISGYHEESPRYYNFYIFANLTALLIGWRVFKGMRLCD